MTEALLNVEDLRVTFAGRGRPVRAVDGVSYCVYPGQTLAIVGESGSGKTVSCRAVMGLLPPAAVITGSACFAGTQLIGLTDDQLRAHRGVNVAMVFQDPTRSLNPTMRIGSQIAEAVGPPAGQQGPGPRASRRAAAPGAHAAAGAALRRVPASAVRRHAAAGRDRHRAGLPAEAAHRR